MTRHRHGRRSATIIEAVMAIVILSVALPPLVMAFAEASIQSIHPSKATVAAFLAIERMEEIIAARCSGSGGYAGVYGESEVSVPVGGFPGYGRAVSVTPTDSNLQPVGNDVGYAKVRVTVSWNGGSNEIAVERLFADF